MFFVRPVELRDLDRLLELAHTVHFINLPPHKPTIENKIDRAAASFQRVAAREIPKTDGERRAGLFFFVLEDPATGICSGTSSIMAGMGGPDHPNLSFQLVKATRRSVTLDEQTKSTTGELEHIIACLFQDRASPSELGAILLPSDLRGGGYGKLMSWIRLHFIALYPEFFAPRILAEMMAPIDKYNDGNLFWRMVPRRFINLPYERADRLSTRTREFMYRLLPDRFNLSLMPDGVLTSIAAVNEQTKPAERMLKDIGFRFTHRIDPFDAGPHYEANRDDISVVKATRRLPLIATDLPDVNEAPYCIVSHWPEGGQFRAVNAEAIVLDQGVRLTKQAADVLNAKPGAELGITPTRLRPVAAPDFPLPEVEMPSMRGLDAVEMARLFAQFHSRDHF
ncbi:MAG: arginine N-succinyltransferase [Phycisphaerales bacterium]|nr:arginine N-succinyltransferase [Phycisphaerales bacterium]